MSDVPNGSAPDAGNPPPPAGDTKWYAGLADADNRGFAELKGWDSPDKAIGSYRELEKFVGVPKERLMALPEKPDDPGWKDIRAKLGFGVPDDIAEYKLPVPEGFGGEFAAQAAAWFKDSDIPPAHAAKVTQKWNEWTEAQIAAQDKAVEQAVADADAALRAEWGGRYNENIALAQRYETALKADVGVSDETLLGWQNHDPMAYRKMLAFNGSAMAEAPHISGEQSGQRTLSPEAAKVRLAELKSNPAWARAVLNGDPAETAEHNRLIEMAHPQRR